MTDNRMKDRVKVMLGTPAETETSEHAMVAPNPRFPDQALQVLTMAQRTAEEHVATAHHQADKIRTDAQSAAEQIARDAQVHAHNVRREADKVLFEARQGSEQLARDARTRTEEAQQNAEKIVAAAQERAAAITAEAQKHAEQLKMAAQLRHDDVVGSLGVRRETLQSQIEALEQFDREYRGRLTSFMQSQLRSLWVEQPQVSATEVLGEQSAEEPAQTMNGFVPAQRPGEHQNGAARHEQREPGQAREPEQEEEEADA